MHAVIYYLLIKGIKVMKYPTIRKKTKTLLLTYQHSTEASLYQQHQPPHIYLELYKELQKKKRTVVVTSHELLINLINFINRFM